MDMENSENQEVESHPLLLVLFWAYVLIPLGWGVFQTFKKAMALFQ
jgi:hypothetical protein